MPAATSAPASTSATQGTSAANLRAEAPAPTPPLVAPSELEPKPPIRYGVVEIKIVVPGADTVTPTHLGDDRSIAGSWRRFSSDMDDDVYPFLWRWGGKTEFGFEKFLPAGYPESLSMYLTHYEGRYFAGAFRCKAYCGACVSDQSFILDTKNKLYTIFDGFPYDLNKRGEATGALGGNPCADPGEVSRAFYWNGEIFESIPDQTPDSVGRRLRDGKVEGFGGPTIESPTYPDTFFVWDLPTGIVTHYLPGDPAGPSFELDPLPDHATLHEQINDDDPWFGRLTFNFVRDVGPDGCILVEGCWNEGCGSFLLIPPQ